MKTIIQSPDFDASPELIDFIEKNVEKLSLFSDRVLAAEFILKLDEAEFRNNKVCELKLVVPGNDLFAKKQCGTFEEAVTASIDAATQQIGRRKYTKRALKVYGTTTYFGFEDDLR